MKNILMILFFLCAVLTAQQNYPHLERVGNTVHLIVDKKPFIILGGELGNSSFTGLDYMEPVWPKLTAMNLNTVLAPVYWELIEPVEGEFDFELYDKLIEKARANDLKLVLLWFGSWKNSMSSHTPAWVKQDQERFPRAKDEQGKSQEILTPLSENNMQADLNAFKALMYHLKMFDEQKNTVIMIQPENEIGMLPTARDYSLLANEKFNSDVPEELIQYLKKNNEILVPEFKEIWEKNGYKESGTWQEIFGKGSHTDEIFMAWYYARFTDKLVEAGKSVYPLPMYVNAALIRPGALPGKGYPSAGPLPHLMDVWKAGAPAIDFLASDIYFPNMKYWCDLYTRQGDPLFIPEAGGGPSAAAKALFTIGHYESLGFSPFSIESTPDPENAPLGKAYGLIQDIMPLIVENQGQNKIEGMLFDKKNPEIVFQLSNYEFTTKHGYSLGYEPGARNEDWENSGAILIQTAENEFYLAGSGIVMTFKNIQNPELTVGILKAEQGKFEDKKWRVIRHLNGDQTHQGRHIRILFEDGYFIQRFELYNYK